MCISSWGAVQGNALLVLACLMVDSTVLSKINLYGTAKFLYL